MQTSNRNLACLLFCLAGSGWSQSFHSRFYTEQDGLPSTSVFGAVQDKGGNLWFATRSGLVRFNGFEWQIHGPEQGLGLTNIRKISVDDQQNIWVLGHALNTVGFFDGVRWSLLPQLKANLVNQRPAFAIGSRQGETVVAVSGRQAGLFLYENRQWRSFGKRNGLRANEVTALVADRGLFYVATTAGISVVTPEGVDNRLNQALPANRRALYGIAVETREEVEDGNDEPLVWLMGQNWVGKIEDNQFEELAKLPGTPRGPGRGTTLFPDGEGGLFCGHESAFYHYNGPTGGIDHFGLINGLIDDGVTAVLRDREDNLWFTGLRGVTVISSLRFANYDKRHGLLEDEVSAVLEWKPDEFLLGHDKGLTYVTPQKKQTIPLNTSSGDAGLRVMDLCRGREGDVWMALSQAGMGHLDAAMKLEIFPFPEGSNNAIYSLFLDKKDVLWVGSEEGLFEFSDGRLIPRDSGGLSSVSIRRICQGRSGTLYFATSGSGIRTYDSENLWRQYSWSAKTENEVYSVLEDSRYRVWVGTLVGLFRLEDGQLVPYAGDGFLINRPVYFVIEDHLGQIWVGTDRGVYRLDGRQGKAYTVREGLAGDETNRAAGLVDSRGRVWIGTNRGLSLYRKDFDRPLPPPPIVEITGIEVAGAEMLPSQAIALAHDRGDVVFHFKALSFLDERGATFLYRLEGYDQDWLSELRSGAGRVRYTSLPPGNFRFHLKAKNSQGVWSDIVETATITVAEPFWITTPAFALYALALLLSVLVVWGIQARLEGKVRRRTQQLQTKNEELRHFQTIVQATNDEIELSEVLQTVLTQGLALFPVAEKGFLLLGDSADFRFAVASGYPMEKLDGFRFNREMLGLRFLEGECLREEIYLSSSPQNRFFGKALAGMAVPDSRLSMALSLEGRVRAYLVLDSFQGAEAFANSDLSRLTRFRAHAVSAIAKGRFLETLHEKNKEILAAQRQLVMREKMASLGTLTTGMAQEINNPINFIANFAGLNRQIVEEIRMRFRAQETLKGSSNWQAIFEGLDELEYGSDIIQSHSNRVSKIIERMLQFSSLAGGSATSQDLDLFQLLEENVASVIMSKGKKWPIKQLKLEKTSDGDVKPYPADMKELGFVFRQLFTNAYEALADRISAEPEHEGILTFRVCQKENRVEIRIADSGLGIIEANKSKIFTPFFTTRDADSGNIGLGLFMSYDIIVNGYDGDLWAERNGGFTELVVSLPLK